MNENELTRRLIIVTLSHSEPSVTRRFLSAVVGVDVQATESGYRYRDQATWENLGHQRAIVVGIAPQPGLSLTDTRTAPGSIVDAVIAGDVAVLFEFKVAGQCQKNQLVRHAHHWALAIADDVPWSDPPPPGFALRTWRDVAAWLEIELARSDLAPADRARLAGLTDVLTAAASRLELGANHKGSPLVSAVAVAVDLPTPTATSAMTTGRDLDGLYDACLRLYGPRGSHKVDARSCRRDVEDMRESFARAGMTPPAGLRGEAMTPRRILSALYCDEGKTDASPAAWTDLRTRVIGRGGDRTVLLAMLAWAQNHAGTAASKNIYKTAARVWQQAPEVQPGMPELLAATEE